MKDQFTLALSDLVQHQAEFQSGIAELLGLAEQVVGASPAAEEIRDRLRLFDSDVAAMGKMLSTRLEDGCS